MYMGDNALRPLPHAIPTSSGLPRAVISTPTPFPEPPAGAPPGDRHPGLAHLWAWRAFIALAVALLPVMVLSSFDFGVTWDEKDRHRNGEHVWQFLRGLRSRSEFAETGGHVYPGLFDAICAALETWLPGNRYVIRNAVNATFGWIGAVYCGRLAARLFGPWAGVLGMTLLAGSPRSVNWRRFADVALRGLAVVVATLVLGTICWPWAGGAPFIRPFQALLGAANYPWDGLVLFMRREYRATELPW
jgi:hypothetical protein